MVECLILMSTALQKLVAQIHDNLDENDQFFPNMKLVIYKSYFDGLNLINFSTDKNFAFKVFFQWLFACKTDANLIFY